MATPDQIPTDLTLEIGGNLSPDKFMSAARAFFGYVEEISRAVSPEGEVPDWVVRIREGSHLIGVDPGPKAHIATVRAVYASIKAGMKKVTSGSLEDSDFPEAAIKHLKTLSDISDGAKTTPILVKLWVQKSSTYIGSDIANAIREDRRANYKDFGTLEGRLEVIRDRRKLEIRVRDTMLQQNISCNISEEMLGEAFALFRQRVEVSGNIHYRKKRHANKH